jgi:AraC-like DNA-binding protein
LVVRETETDVSPTPSPLLRISTETLPERERFSAFQEEFAQQILKMDVINHSAAQCPRIDVAIMPLGRAAAGTVWATPVEFIRRNHHLKDCNDDFRLTVVATGTFQFSHAGEEGIYDIGWAHLADQARPYRGIGSGGYVRNITVQGPALKALVAYPEDLAGQPVRPGPALRLLDGYLQSLTSLEEPPSPELAPIIGEHLLDLLAAALGPTAEAAEVIAKRGVKAARLRAILAEVARRFSDPSFDLDNVAGTLGLSRRYIQELLEETGKSFTEHLVERRLERASAMLSDQRCQHLAIIDIAFAVGFGDVSHFNRVFRRRFGETPSAVRAGAIAPEQK